MLDCHTTEWGTLRPYGDRATGSSHEESLDPEMRKVLSWLAHCRPGQTMQIPDRPPSRGHIKPRSKGHALAGNPALVCCRCNTDKGSLSLGQRLTRLARAGDARADQVAAFIGLHLATKPGRGLPGVLCPIVMAEHGHQLAPTWGLFSEWDMGELTAMAWRSGGSRRQSGEPHR
jgi:hypothetical protein